MGSGRNFYASRNFYLKTPKIADFGPEMSLGRRNFYRTQKIKTFDRSGYTPKRVCEPFAWLLMTIESKFWTSEKNLKFRLLGLPKGNCCKFLLKSHISQISIDRGSKIRTRTVQPRPGDHSRGPKAPSHKLGLTLLARNFYPRSIEICKITFFS